MDNIETKLNNLSSQLSSLNNGFSSLSSGLSSIATQLGYIKTEIKTGDSNITSAITTLSTNLSTYFSSVASAVETLENELSQFHIDTNNNLSNIKQYLNDIKVYITQFYSRNHEDIVNLSDMLNNMLTGLMFELHTYFSAIGEYLDIDWQADFDTDDITGIFSYRLTHTLHEMLLEVYQEIDDMVNPRSDNNIDSFNASLSNIQENTFIGSAYTFVDSVPNNIISALSTDSSPVLKFNISGVSNSIYSIPAKTISIDFSWYAPYKATGDTVISCFMYLGFLFALWKRLPEILHGSGMVFTGGLEFSENQINDTVNDIMANDYYEYLNQSGGYDGYDDF